MKKLTLTIEINDGLMTASCSNSKKQSSFKMEGRIPLEEDEKRFYENIIASIQSKLMGLVVNGEVTDFKITGNIGAGK